MALHATCLFTNQLPQRRPARREKREKEKQTSVASPKVLALPRISSIYPDARRAQSLLSMTNGASKESPLSPGYPGTNAQALITNQPICSQSIVPPNTAREYSGKKAKQNKLK